MREDILTEGFITQGFITTEDGVRLFFQQSGSGPKTVVIPNGIYMLEDFGALGGEFTLIAYDPRHRGRSDAVAGDLHRDVEDLEAVRRHFGIERLNLIGHSYIGLMIALYAMKYPANVECMIEIGPVGPVGGKQYPAHLAYADRVMPEAFAKLARMQQEWQGREQQNKDEVEFARKAFEVLGPIYVANPALAGKINWGRAELPNERNFMTYWSRHILPSIMSIRLNAEDASKVEAPVLVIHGTKDRNAPYGGGREWAMILPDARLVTAEDTAHAPWVESPDLVFEAMRTFFAGAWPKSAEEVVRPDGAEAASA